ncbi:hypothetical protein JHK82_013147 [Glycine max]|uniref:Uncharacterized protein n=3 Tax=Glycine subgen. Soja TaxID=1462606 RepID=A0A0R0K1F8_SOYBN|nr:hypothetical protein JHK82_013147 [Glycine max]KRH59065.1 hypothetical protein GLYMA_05G164000v4 [Glycine max]RZC12753.1 hypothetical protein D0Y65_012491 [Glycine soja]
MAFFIPTSSAHVFCSKGGSYLKKGNAAKIITSCTIEWFLIVANTHQRFGEICGAWHKESILVCNT